MPSKAKKSAKHEDDQTEFVRVDKNLYRRQLTGQYYGFLKRGGKKFKRSLKTKDRKLAERMLAKLKREVVNLSLTEDSDITFEDLAKRWLDIVKHSLKTSTVKRRELCIRTLSPFFGHTRVRKISSSQSEKWVVTRGKKIAASTFHQELDTMRMIFDFAVEKGLMLTNPAAGIKRRRVTKKEMIIPTRDQLKSLIEAIRVSDGRLDSQQKAKAGADMVEFLAYSGCRIGEAREVLWRHVDFDKGVLWVHGGEEGTKNHEIRKIRSRPAIGCHLLKRKAENERDNQVQ
jgi:integrase